MRLSFVIFINNLLIGLTIMRTCDGYPQFTKEDESYEETDDVDDVYDEEKIVVVTIAKQKPSSTSTTTTTEKELTILRNSANTFEIIQIDSNKKAHSNVQKLVITIPNNSDGSGGGTIELEIPMEAMSQNETGNSDPKPMANNILTMDNQNVKNIEGAILEALHFAQKTGGMNMRTKTNLNGTETFELDIGNFYTTEAYNVAAEGKVQVNTTAVRRPPLEQSLPPGPITDFINSQIKNGQKLMSGKLKPADFLVSAFEALECVVGYWCNDDDE